MLCLHFKWAMGMALGQAGGQDGSGRTVFGKDYGASGSFRLYDAQAVLATLQGHSMALVDAIDAALGDPQGLPGCFMWQRAR